MFGSQNTVVVVGNWIVAVVDGPNHSAGILDALHQLGDQAPILSATLRHQGFRTQKGLGPSKGSLEKQWRLEKECRVCRPLSFQAASPMDVETVGEALLCLSSATMSFPRSPSRLALPMDQFSNAKTSFWDHDPLPPILYRLMDRLASVDARGTFSYSP